MTATFKDALHELLEYEGRAIEDHKQIRINAIRRMTNYQFDEGEAYRDGFNDYLAETIVMSQFANKLMLEAIEYVLTCDL